jgi:hypothetical protein
MIRACFALAAMPAFKEMGFYRSAHMLGYRGHCATKSRLYSTTFGALRSERRSYRDAERRDRLGLPAIDGRQVVVDAEWKFVRSGLAYGEAPFVDALVRQRATARTIAPDYADDSDAA